MAEKKKILITDPIHPDAVAALREAGFEITELEETQRSQLANIVAPYHAIICRTSTPIDGAVFAAAKNLRCIALASTGYDRIDTREALKRNIPVLGLPSYNPDIDPERDGNFVSTAEHAVLLILAALDDFYHANQSMKEQRWEKKFLVGNELAGKTVGLIGLGRIAGLVAKRLAGFNVTLIAYDPYVRTERANTLGVTLVSFAELCERADILSIHAPLTHETTHLIDAEAFGRMKKGVFVINTARSDIIDESALIDALKDGTVKRVALDVFHDEPDNLNWDLIALPNVIATPHIGGSTHEAWRRISLSAADNVISFFHGTVKNRLNPPQKAVILAAGSGTRLRPLTENRPKSLLEVGGKTILDHQIEGLLAVGVKELVLVVGYRKDMIMDHLNAKNYPIKITYIHNDNYAKTKPILGGLVPAREHLSEPVIFAHCDVLFSADALKQLMAHPDDSVQLYRKGAYDDEAGKIITGSDNTVQELGKHIKKDYATGEYLQIARFGQQFCERLLAALDARMASGEDSFTIDIFNDVVKEGSVRVTGVPFEGTTLEIDTVEDYENACEEYKKQ